MTTYPPEPPPAPAPPTWPDARDAPDAPDRQLLSDANIQGNILAGFNKSHQSLLMVQLPSQAVGQAWLKDLIPRVATNAAVAAFNARFSKQRRAAGGDPENLFAVWTNVSLTAAGIRLLDPAAIDDLAAHPAADPGIHAWLAGANDPATLTDVGDVTTADWLFGAATPVHAIVCIAADRPDDLELEVTRQRETAARLGVPIVFEQPGATLPGRAAGHEHFGFKDGISQPGILGFDEPSTDPNHVGEVKDKLGTDLIPVGHFILGYKRDPAPAIPVPRWLWDGSFLVTRRLAQDVPGFWAGMETAHATLTPPQTTDADNGIPSADALAARLVGRWRSGTPTEHAPVHDNRSAVDPAQDNNFNFGTDLPGDRTPPCAHIRKVYPRGGLPEPEFPTPDASEASTVLRRIIRRGIPFGLPFQPTRGRGEGVDAERGLVFQCYQASLTEQFIFLQQTWVNGLDFPSPADGRDAVIGLASAVTVRAGGQPATLSFQDFVRTQGTLFSLTPSVQTLHALATGTPLES